MCYLTEMGGKKGQCFCFWLKKISKWLFYDKCATISKNHIDDLKGQSCPPVGAVLRHHWRSLVRPSVFTSSAAAVAAAAAEARPGAAH